MKKIAIVLMIITVFSKLTGLFREVILSYYYGTSNISDAYLIASTIPTVIFSFIGTGIVTGFIPIYEEIKKNNGENECLSYVNNLTNILLIIVTIIVGVILIFTESIVFVFASGFDLETFNIAVTFTRISIFGTYFTAMVFLFNGFLQANGKYNITSLIGLPLNIIVIISIYFSKYFNLNWLPYGIVISVAGQLLLLIPSIKNSGFKYNLTLNFNDYRIKKLIKISTPVILGVSIYQINVLVDRTMASRIVLGGISALNYSNNIIGFVQGIFVLSITTVSYPMLSKYITNKNFYEVKRTLKESINLIMLLVIPASIGCMIFSKEIVNLIFGRGAIDNLGLKLTSDAFFMYSIGMIAYGLKEGTSKVFYAMQDSKTPMRNSAIGFLLNIVLNLVLSKIMGVSGLALATSLSAIFTTILLFISLRNKIGPFGLNQLVVFFIKILLASSIMGVIVKLLYSYLIYVISNNISLIISMIIGVISYFIIIYFMKIEDFNTIVESIKNKLIRK